VARFFAGHEASATALSWALFLLAVHPDVADEVRDERAGAPGRDAVLLAGVVKETLGLLPAGLGSAAGRVPPVGRGPRMCLGARLAETTVQLVLATIVRRARLSLVDSIAARPEGAATLRPRGGLRMRVDRLDG
jgi:cytochrome P450